MGHNPRSNSASTKGQQVWSGTGTTASTEGETDFSHVTTTTIECSGVAIIKLSWTTTTSCTQAGGEAHADKFKA